MQKTIVTEKQVKEALNVNKFSELSKDKIMEFVSLIPHMDKDIAISVIKQFPAYADVTKTMVSQLEQLCEAAIQDNNFSQREVAEAYKKYLMI